MGTSSCARSARPPRDRGFSLIEVIVAFALLAVMATALLVVVVASQKLTREDTARVAANNLAMRELEITRDAFADNTRGPTSIEANRVLNPNPLPGGTSGQPLTVDGVPFTVTREAQWASLGTDVSTCDDGSNAELAYLKVEVEVSWPALGSRPPVTMDTVMTPLKGNSNVPTGHLGLKVLDRLGVPREAVSVSVTSGGTTRTAQTTDDGCVLFAFLPPGTYTVTLNGSGAVDPSGNPTATRTVTVEAGRLWRGSQDYDKAAAIAATLTTKADFALPTELAKVPVSLGNSALLPSGSRPVTGTGSVRNLTNLWPYPSGYQLWGGACADADPGDAADLPVTSGPGQTTTARVYLPALRVTTPGSNQTITATHAADSGCTAYSMVLGQTGSDKTLRTSLPYGTWKLSRTSSGSGSGPSTQTSVTVAAPSLAAEGQPAPPAEPVTEVTLP